MDGLTEQEIADKVGYKTASTVHKRIAKIVGAYEDYVTVEYQKYLDKLTDAETAAVTEMVAAAFHAGKEIL